MCSQVINSIGLVLDIVGAVILFFFGPPQPSFEKGVGIIAEDATPLSDGRAAAEHDQDMDRVKAKYTLISRLAMAIIAIGFVLQLVAMWL